MNAYVYIFIVISYFFIITHKEIKTVAMGLENLLLRMFLSILITSFPVYFLYPDFFSEHDSLFIYIATWLLVLTSYIGHWLYRKNIHVSN